MTRNEANKYLVAILTTAAETEPASFPESMAYLAMGADLGKWEFIRGLLAHCGLMTFEGHDCKLTDEGRRIAAKIQDSMKAA